MYRLRHPRRRSETVNDDDDRLDSDVADVWRKERDAILDDPTCAAASEYVRALEAVCEFVRGSGPVVRSAMGEQYLLRILDENSLAPLLAKIAERKVKP